jgi:hypothetical protein
MPTPPTDAATVTRDDLRRVAQEIDSLRGTVEQMAKDQQVQFTRIAQLQADIDVVRSAWTKLKPETRSSQTYAGPERRLTSRKK